jgi:hypothetical protein
MFTMVHVIMTAPTEHWKCITSMVLKMHNKHDIGGAQQAQLWRCTTSMIKSAWQTWLKITPLVPSRDIHKVKKHGISISSVVIKGVRVKTKVKKYNAFK